MTQLAFFMKEIFLPNKKKVCLLMSIHLVLMMLGLFVPYLNYVFIHLLEAGKLTMTQLILILFSLLCVLALQCGLNFSVKQLMLDIQKRYHDTIREKILRHLLKQDMLNRDMDIIYLLSRDIFALDVWMEKLCYQLVLNIGKLLVLLGILMYLQLQLTLIALGISLITFSLLRKFTQRLNKVSADVKDVQKVCRKAELEWLENSIEIKINQLERLFIEKQVNLWQKQHQVFKTLKIFELCLTIYNAFDRFILEVLMIYLLGGYFVYQGQLDLSLLILYANYYLIFNATANTIRQDFIDYQSHSQPYIRELMTYMASIPLKTVRKKLSPSDWSVHLIDVEYTNPLGKQLFKRLNGCIESGEALGIYGRSGGGKTTLLKIMCGKLNLDCGQVCIGDCAVNELEDLSQYVYYAEQSPLIITGTIRDNLRLVNPNLSDEAMLKACQDSGLGGKVGILDQEIGEYGQGLSGGERQRLAFARAIVADTPILLLDEPTSALDAENEAKIVATLACYKREKTIIIVSHRMSTLQFVDRCIDLAMLDNSVMN